MDKRTSFFRRSAAFLFPDSEGRDAFRLFFALSLFKILLFDYCWSASSTFRAFSYAETYVFAVLWALACCAPIAVFRSVTAAWIVDLTATLLLVSNLAYFRTYFTAIPLSSYKLIGNMVDFTDSVSGSLHYADALFPLSTVVAIVLYCKKRRRETERLSSRLKTAGRYLALTATVGAIGSLLIATKGGFRKSYEAMQGSYTHTCCVPMYTIVGSACYDYIRERDVYTEAIGRHIKEWTAAHEARVNADCNAVVDSADGRRNCIIILAESLESWVIGQTVEGQEITPCLNRLLKYPTTLYAPYVLSQVKGGRSIDAQLMINAGLLPINTGAYSLKYPHSRYPSLAEAMKEKYGKQSVKARILTADKPLVWNLSVIAPSLGYDALFSRNNFVHDERVGPSYRPQLGDVSLLRQCAEKIVSGEAWSKGVNLLQIVTYSGHFPFILPEHLRGISFTGEMPERLRDYMTVANYTDRALGAFVEALRSSPEFDNTLIVITGDHEGLAKMRGELAASKAGRGLTSPDPFTPLIIVNAPASARSRGVFEPDTACMLYKKVIGQIDIYPTMLELMGLTGYAWKGVGESILHLDKPSLAVDAHGRLYGDTTSTAAVLRLKEAWRISDEIIRYDYFSGRDGALK